MSGHSKWAKIKRQKGINDIKKGALFTKIARNITLAAKEGGGGDPTMNFSLRLAIEKAKVANMPTDNIDRAIKKGTGDGEKFEIKRITYEGFATNGVSVLIDCQTDNTNRTVSEVKQILETAGGKFASAGSVNWKFHERGLITLRAAKKSASEKFGEKEKISDCTPEDLELELFEIQGITDVQVDREFDEEQQKDLDILYVYTDKNEFAQVIAKIEALKIVIISAELVKEPNEYIDLNQDAKQKLNSLIENLEELDDVDAVWVDVKL